MMSRLISLCCPPWHNFDTTQRNSRLYRSISSPATFGGYFNTITIHLTWIDYTKKFYNRDGTLGIRCVYHSAAPFIRIYMQMILPLSEWCFVSVSTRWGYQIYLIFTSMIKMPMPIPKWLWNEPHHITWWKPWCTCTMPHNQYLPCSCVIVFIESYKIKENHDLDKPINHSTAIVNRLRDKCFIFEIHVYLQVRNVPGISNNDTRCTTETMAVDSRCTARRPYILTNTSTCYNTCIRYSYSPHNST